MRAQRDLSSAWIFSSVISQLNGATYATIRIEDHVPRQFRNVAGAVRLKNLMVKTDGLAATGNAVIDFNTMALDSDWNLAFDPVDRRLGLGALIHGQAAARMKPATGGRRGHV